MVNWHPVTEPFGHPNWKIQVYICRWWCKNYEASAIWQQSFIRMIKLKPVLSDTLSKVMMLSARWSRLRTLQVLIITWNLHGPCGSYNNIWIPLYKFFILVYSPLFSIHHGSQLHQTKPWGDGSLEGSCLARASLRQWAQLQVGPKHVHTVYI